MIPADFQLVGRTALLFVCRGECPRDARPLACRLFPARILPDGEIAMDTRSAEVCPIYDSGTDAFAPAFRAALRDAASALLADESCRTFLAELDAALRL